MDLAHATDHPANHPYVRLAVAMSEAAVDGVCRLMLGTHGAWQALIPWIEQLMEESLGKGGKGAVVFADTPLTPNARLLSGRRHDASSYRLRRQPRRSGAGGRAGGTNH